MATSNITDTGRRSTLDAIGAFLGSVVYRRRRLFHRSIETPSLREAVPATTVRVETLDPGHWHEVRSEGSAGELKAGYLVHRWIGMDRPSLIYVHGSGEQPRNFSRSSDNSFRRIVETEFDVDALGDLRNYVGILATTTALVDSLAKRLRDEGALAVYGAAFSLGAWVLNLRRDGAAHYLR